MDDFLEFEKDTKALKSINLDDFSIEDLENYIEQLKKEINRVSVFFILVAPKKYFDIIKPG